MYQSLYRTYRPRTFSDMVGQDAIVRTLRNQVKSKHIAHAYLFCGSRGTGKTSAARIMSLAINCLSPKEGDPCLECENCRTLLNEASLDVFEMDAASNSRVEEIRDMLEKVNYPPQHLPYKVYIIDEVHMLSNAAFNALLKTLEEPPAYMVFILATTEPQKLPATILSRCQRFDFGRIPEDAIVHRLKAALTEETSAEEGALRLIASAAEGAMRDAWSLMDMCLERGQTLTEERVRTALGAVNRAFLFDYLSLLRNRDAKGALQMADELLRAGKDTQVFLKDLSRHIRDVIACALGAEPAGETTENIEKLKQQAEGFPLPMLTHYLDLAMRTEADSRWAASQRAVLEVFTLRACLMTEDDSPLALMARIAALEKDVEALKSGAVAIGAPAKGKKEPIPVSKTDTPEKETPVSKKETAGEKAAPPPVKVKSAPTATEKLPKDAWNAMLARAKKELVSMFGFISQGKFAGFKDGCFRLSLDSDHEFVISFLNEAARKEAIEKILTEELGAAARFEAVKEDTTLLEQSRAEIAQQDIDLISELAGRDKLIVRE